MVVDGAPLSTVPTNMHRFCPLFHIAVSFVPSNEAQLRTLSPPPTHERTFCIRSNDRRSTFCENHRLSLQHLVPPPDTRLIGHKGWLDTQQQCALHVDMQKGLHHDHRSQNNRRQTPVL